MTRALFHPQDADQVIADFGVTLVCVAVPGVTRGLVEDVVVDETVGEASSKKKLCMLKVKAGAFGTTKVKNTRVTVVDDGREFSIDDEVAHDTTLFDWYALQPFRVRTP